MCAWCQSSDESGQVQHRLTVPAGTPVVLAPREHLQFTWLPWREAADRCFSPSNAEAVLHLPRFVG